MLIDWSVIAATILVAQPHPHMQETASVSIGLTATVPEQCSVLQLIPSSENREHYQLELGCNLDGFSVSFTRGNSVVAANVISASGPASVVASQSSLHLYPEQPGVYNLVIDFDNALLEGDVIGVELLPL